MYLTYTPWFLFKAVNRFWVGKVSVSISSCKTYPYFTPLTSRTGLYEGIFQQEPAIARLDRLFTPIHRSSKYMFIITVQPSIPLSEDFSLPMNRSPGFRSNPRDWRTFILAFALVALHRRLASPRRITPRPVLQNVRYKSFLQKQIRPVTNCSCQISNLFTLCYECFSAFPRGTIALSDFGFI